MQEDAKKSFVLYMDYMSDFDALPDEMAGKLIKAIFHRAAGEELGQIDPVIDVMLRFIGRQMDRDAEKWQRTRDRRREAGRKGGEAKKSTSEGVQVKQSLANQAVTVNGTVTDTVNVNGTVTCNEGEAQAAVKAAMGAGVKPSTKRKTKFSNFPERTYDYAELERQLL